MGFTESSRYCRLCKRQVLVRQETPNHTVHVLITLLSCGLWGIVWLALTLMALGNPWRCSNCGSPTTGATMPTGFRQLQPSIGRPLNHTKIFVVVVAVLGALSVVGLIVELTKRPNGNTRHISTSEPVNQTPKSSPTPSITTVQTKAPSPTPESSSFDSETSRRILASFFIKPVLRQMLNNPDSLQDLEVTSVVPVKKMTGVYRATVFYRAENGFGALVAQEQTFMVTRGTGTGFDAWRITPAR